MAQLNATETISLRKNGKHPRKGNPTVDMTPMVDLGFLLICFFVFTTTLSTPAATDLFMPKESTDITLIKNSESLTLLLDNKGRVFCYDGIWDDALKYHRVITTGYSVQNGFGDVIRKKQELMNEAKGKAGRDRLMLIIKASKNSSYKNFVDALDEMMINDVKRYAVTDLSPEEDKYLSEQ
ncbi:MAG: biopolymer transporter ExbD [Chitinophagaceae bacterium]